MATAQKLTKEQAQRKVDAIDKRIDAITAELIRTVPVFDDMSAHGWQIAWDSYPGLEGMKRSLYLRRYDAQKLVDEIEWREARAAERQKAREYRKAFEATRHACPTCGDTHYSIAA